MIHISWFSVALRPQRQVGLLGTGTEWKGGERVEGSTAETAQKRPERPWTAARTMEVLRRCPLTIAQRLVHCAIALSTAVLDRVTKTMSVAPLLTNNLDNSKQKTSNLLRPAPPPYSWSLLGKCEGPAPPPSSKISWSFDLTWNPYFLDQICLNTPPLHVALGAKMSGSIRKRFTERLYKTTPPQKNKQKHKNSCILSAYQETNTDIMMPSAESCWLKLSP